MKVRQEQLDNNEILEVWILMSSTHRFRSFVKRTLKSNLNFGIDCRHKAIADYLFQCGFEDALNAFKKDANMVRSLNHQTVVISVEHT